MHCRECGHHVSEKTEICPNCGVRPLNSHHYCQSCGSETSEKQEMCVQCGVRLQQVGSGSQYYAGFWLRAVAYLLDGIILAIPLTFIGTFMATIFIASDPYAFQTEGSAAAFEMGAFLIGFVFNALYTGIFHASKWQATPGKKMIGIKVTDMNGNRISFARGFGRGLAVNLSAFILYIGFIMAGLTSKKQALHDMIARTLVIRSR
ncbi:RDD family protein [Alkalibacillus salilacus]|uniref:RDD family membrane protein YckC/RNA polymerase subunit RPABC4/transcription elongation factor Spt4 n=1 Tax=Alkalibacillus salilacus TaxID=284582 RepID=A0ABT9VHM7_9BACI|nr:RDD family protein [Alkalibacillus salilacus]MDQ0160458.1 putative RDD family membrane protein YckC/RNA polymerase subunit RPABC4/transcription elongation factor Spt4 [Alkalibacillus salilacus]